MQSIHSSSFSHYSLHPSLQPTATYHREQYAHYTTLLSSISHIIIIVGCYLPCAGSGQQSFYCLCNLIYKTSNSFETDGYESKKDRNNNRPPWRLLLNPVYRLNGLYMKIYDEQSKMDIVLLSNILFGAAPIDPIFTTSLLSTN